jgi:hypothetical protein
MKGAMEKCNKDCLNCTIEKCVEDRQISLNLPPNTKDRRPYYKEYYKRTKGAKNAHKRADYWYINKKQTLDVIRGLKKKIGQVNAQIIIEALDQLDTRTIDENV